MLTIKDYLDLTGGNPQTQTFTYDALDRLTSAVAVNGTNGTYTLQNYSYNATTGNLSIRAGVNYTYGDTNHDHAVTAMGSDSYSYDNNGNQVTRNVSGSSYTLSYDAENRLVGVSGAVTATFVYDGDGNRVKAIVGTTTTTYVGGYFEWTGSTSTMIKYYYAGATRVAMRTGSSTINYLLGDHLGSQAITTNSSGVKSGEVRYYPWGTERYTSGTTPTSFKFTGQRFESTIGLYFYNARWYDSSAGRFIQADTIVPGAGNPQAWDRYAYTSNNPIRYTDPTGHCIDGISTAICIAVAVSAITGGVASAAGYIAATRMAGQEINVKSLAVATGAGVVAGALAPIIAVTAPIAAVIPATLTMYGAVSATQYVVNQTVNDKPIDPIATVANFGVGAATGILGGVYSPFDEIGREGMSQGLKLGMDFGKQTLIQGEKESAQQFLNYQVVNGVSNFLRTFTTSLLQTVAPKNWEH